MGQKLQNEEFYRAVKRFHDTEELPDLRIDVQHSGLIPLLRPYQKKAVEWMVRREIQGILEDITLSQVNILDQEPCSSSYSHDVNLTRLPSGGILADEMGLGKTIEVLACVLSNPRDGVVLPEEDDILPTKDETENLRKQEDHKKNMKIVVDFKKSKIEKEDWPLAIRLAETKNEKMKIRKKMKRLGRKKKNKNVQVVMLKDEKPRKDEGKKSATRLWLGAWYDSKLSEVNRNPIRAAFESMEGSQVLNVQCVCGNTDENNLVTCRRCSRLLHKNCIGALKWSKYIIYCPQCWLEQEPVKSRATLIVSPASISSQWFSEVNNHISKDLGLKVLIYKGVRVDGFSQPFEFVKYDVILTTYEVLRSELDLAQSEVRRPLRYEKKYFTPTCPLLCVEFWRVCLDEAQMVEGTTTKAAEMVSRMSSIHRWAITGTPIQKTMHDLYGLVMFIGIEPYCYLKSWNEDIFRPFCNGNKLPLYTLLAHIMWRSSKRDVLDQIQIPPQTEQTWWLNFSPVEEHFYHRTHLECKNDFLERLRKFDTLDIALDSKDVKVSQVLAPLLKLRQACSHPQAVRGNLIAAQKGTMTMSELLESLIKKTKAEGEEALRAYIVSLNGMAGLHIIVGEIKTAAEKYRGVLQIAEEYKDRFKVDTLQRIHTLHNLGSILKDHRDLIPPTLRDDKLCEEEQMLVAKYLIKAQGLVTAVEEDLSEMSAAVLHLEADLDTMDDPDWWVDLSRWLSKTDAEDVLMRVHEALLDNRKTQAETFHSSIINRVASFQGIQMELAVWMQALEMNRNKALKSLRVVQITEHESLVNRAVDCHLRLSNLKSKTVKAFCALCECEKLLKDYERSLFNVRGKKQENEMMGDVFLLGQTTQGSWAASEPEKVLRVLVAAGKLKKADPSTLKVGVIFLKLLDALRKEFKTLRLLWTRINERTCARDELNMCKLRLRLRYPDEPLPSSSPSKHVSRRKQETNKLSSNIDTKMENLHIVELHKVEVMALNWRAEAGTALRELKKKSGTVMYLQNLRRNDESHNASNPELCPVCRAALGIKWGVLACGHCYCMDCMPQLLGRTKTQCAICREVTDHQDMSFVNLKQETPENEPSSDIQIRSVRGSHSTKVEAVIRKLFYLRAVDPKVKVLVFSTWDRVLDVLEVAMEQNGVQHVRLKSGHTYHLALQQFKNMKKEEPITALLLSLKHGAKGLNLTEATHVMLVEPILNPAEELQAIGRIHRIGQTRPTVVHRFLVKGTIEERMFSAVQATGREQWGENTVTLRQLKDLFSNVECEYVDVEDAYCSSEPSVLQGGATTPEATPVLENSRTTSELLQNGDEQCADADVEMPEDTEGVSTTPFSPLEINMPQDRSYDGICMSASEASGSRTWPIAGTSVNATSTSNIPELTPQAVSVEEELVEVKEVDME